VGNPTRVRRAELSTASPDLVNTPGSRSDVMEAGRFGGRVPSRVAQSSWEEPGGSTPARGRRRTTLKGPETQESIERSADLTEGGDRNGLAPGSKALKPHHKRPADRSPLTGICSPEGHVGRRTVVAVNGTKAQGVERRHGSGRGESSEGHGTP